MSTERNSVLLSEVFTALIASAASTALSEITND